VLTALVGMICALAAPAAAVSEGSVKKLSASQALAGQILGQMNAVRAQHGLGRLRLSARLNAAAAAHSVQMGRRGYFSHNSADGSAFWKRVQRFYRSGGYRFWAVGENLLWSSPGVDAGRAIQMWMNSPPHRENLLSARWREVGLSAVHVSNARGVFGGHEVTIVTADFGVRH
jgi:uncharacterized protein YkwD